MKEKNPKKYKREMMFIVELLIAINTPSFGVELTSLAKSVNQGSGH